MDQHQRITIYNADTVDRSFFKHFQAIIRELPDAHELGYRLFIRNVKAMYRQSLLGFTWALLPPLFTAGIWIFLRGNNVIKSELLTVHIVPKFEIVSINYPEKVVQGVPAKLILIIKFWCGYLNNIHIHYQFLGVFINF